MDYQAVVDHLQANYIAYGIAALCLLPVLILGRKYVVPFILYVIEICIYISLVHLTIFTIAKVAAWFRDSSSFDQAFGRDSEKTEWSTPLLEPWDRFAYEPGWIFWFEIVVFVLIIIAVFRYRPMKVHKGRERKYTDTGRRVGAGGKNVKSSRPGPPMSGPKRY